MIWLEGEIVQNSAPVHWCMQFFLSYIWTAIGHGLVDSEGQSCLCPLPFVRPSVRPSVLLGSGLLLETIQRAPLVAPLSVSHPGEMGSPENSPKDPTVLKTDEAKCSREEKSTHHHRGDPPFFLFPGLRLYGVYPSFRTYGVYPFPWLSQENGIHHSFFCSVTSGSGDRPRKEGSHGGGVYSFFPCVAHCYAVVFFTPAIFRVAQEPNRNRKPEPSEPFSP